MRKRNISIAFRVTEKELDAIEKQAHKAKLDRTNYLIAAHAGGMRECWGVLDLLVGTRIFIDTSRTNEMAKDPALSPLLQTILTEHDPARILFGSDLPWMNPADTLSYDDGFEQTM